MGGCLKLPFQIIRFHHIIHLRAGMWTLYINMDVLSATSKRNNPGLQSGYIRMTKTRQRFLHYMWRAR